MFEYRAEVLDVHDGDTVSLNADLGFSTFRKMRIRLLGINAPEMKLPDGITYNPDGIVSRTKLLNAVQSNANVLYVRTVKVESAGGPTEKLDVYGRFLAYLWTDQGQMEANSIATTLNYQLWKGGYARRFMTPKDWPLA